MQEINEKTYLVNKNRVNGLSTFFAIICIMDVFGVFPVVTLPKAIMDCGFYGVIVIFLVCSMQIYTAALLGRCWIIAEEICPSIKSKNRYPYAALADLTFGRHFASFVTFLLDLTVFGGGIPNLIVASQNLQLLGLRASDGSVDISYCFWIIMVGTLLCPILWLGSPKDMKLMCSISATIVTLVFLLITGCLLFTKKENTSQENSLQPEVAAQWKNILKAYGIIAFQFDIHPSILTIQVDMLEKSHLSKALLGGFSITLIMFGITTLVAYLNWGILGEPSILETLPTTIPLHLTAALVSIQLCLTSAVSNSALYQQMEDCMGISRDFNSKRCVLRTSLTIFAIVIAESVPRFDLVMSIIGGTLTGPLVFIIPPLIFMKIRSMRKIHIEQLALASFTNIIFTKDPNSPRVSRYIERKFEEEFEQSSNFVGTRLKYFFKSYVEGGLCIFILFVSVILILATTYINFSNVIYSYTNVTRPCIYNVSIALIYS